MQEKTAGGGSTGGETAEFEGKDELRGKLEEAI